MSGLDNTSETVRTVTANTTLTNNDYILLVTTSGSTAYTITVPAGSTVQPGRTYVVRRDATSSGTVSLTPASGTINGTSSLALTASTACSAQIVTDGTNWFSYGASL
jgi:uncharacterized membrane protein YbhN (UPF0104 family)